MIPEPATLVLLAAGVVLLVAMGSWLAGGLITVLRRTLGSEHFDVTLSVAALGGIVKWTGVRAALLVGLGRADRHFGAGLAEQLGLAERHQRIGAELFDQPFADIDAEIDVA